MDQSGGKASIPISQRDRVRTGMGHYQVLHYITIEISRHNRPRALPSCKTVSDRKGSVAIAQQDCDRFELATDHGQVLGRIAIEISYSSTLFNAPSKQEILWNASNHEILGRGKRSISIPAVYRNLAAGHYRQILHLIAIEVSQRSSGRNKSLITACRKVIEVAKGAIAISQ